MNLPFLPKNIERIKTGESFTFECHPDVKCYTDCCRQLELALTPYDVLRLKNGLKISSKEFLERYVIIEQEENEVFPRLYLTMVDDGKASCVFVSDRGCTLYKDRPGACRAYPTGRAAIRNENNQIEDFFVLLKEDHCFGFQEKQQQTADSYALDQELSIYNEFNDALIAILQHDKIRKGMSLTEKQTNEFVLALYDLDTFKEKLLGGSFDTHLPPPQNKDLEDDEKFLLFTIEWIKQRLFG